jgi:hypothetical protein
MNRNINHFEKERNERNFTINQVLFTSDNKFSFHNKIFYTLAKIINIKGLLYRGDLYKKNKIEWKQNNV